MAKKSPSREARLAAALRANLKRRKEAERARRVAAGGDAGAERAARPNPDKKAD